MYQIGDYIVKSTSGVCQIRNIVNPDFVEDAKKLYYQLIPLSDEHATLYIPVDKKDNMMRPVMKESEAKEFIEKIPSIHEIWINNDKERESRYKEAIKSNDPERIVGIIKLIYHRKKSREEQGKEITTVDERYFDIAEKLLYSELEIVMKKDKDEIYDLIRKNCMGKGIE